MNSQRPELSIVIAWQKSQTADLCLESIYKQASARVVEVILVYGAFEPPDRSVLTSKYPRLAIFKHPNSGSLPYLHGYGIEQAHGDLVAITEAHTTFAADWIESVISISSSKDAAAVGGAVEPGPNLTDVDFALYLCDYAQFALPLDSSVSIDLPGNNIVFRRQVIESSLAGKDLKKDGFWKTFFCHDLEKSGKTLLRYPKMVAYYNRHLPLPAVLNRRYLHGRCFGAMRSSGFSASKKAIYMASCMILPVVLCKRLIAKIVSKPSLMRRAALVFPICYLIICAWVHGEYDGTGNGANGSCDQL